MTAPPTATTTREGRWYVDPLTSARYPAVSNILKATTSSAYLTTWAAKLAATYAVEKHHLIGELLADGQQGAAAAVELIAKAPDRYRDAKGERGDLVHDTIRALVLWAASDPGQGDDLALPELTPEAEALVGHFLDWHASWAPVFELVETTVCRTGLNGWAGTLDAIAYLPALGGRFLVDYKSGRTVGESTVAQQLTAYRHADEAWLQTATGWEKRPLPAVDGAVVLHLTDDGFAVVPVETGPEELEAFLHARALYTWQQERRPQTLGRRLRLPGEPVPLADYEGAPYGRACRALERAGVRTVAQLAELTADQLCALPGIGPKAATAAEALLAELGLDLRAEVSA